MIPISRQRYRLVSTSLEMKATNRCIRLFSVTRYGPRVTSWTSRPGLRIRKYTLCSNPVLARAHWQSSRVHLCSSLFFASHPSPLPPPTGLLCPGHKGDTHRGGSRQTVARRFYSSVATRPRSASRQKPPSLPLVLSLSFFLFSFFKRRRARFDGYTGGESAWQRPAVYWSDKLRTFVESR